MLVFAIFAFFAHTADAHDTWLQPRRAEVLPGTIAQLDLTSGEKFPAADHAIKQERIGVAKARLNGAVLQIAPGSPEKKFLELRVALPDAGIATLWLSLKPHPVSLGPAEVKHYLAEIDASQAVKQAWTASKPPLQWRELYTKHVKTFVKVGRPKADRSWNQPVGLPLEIVPESDPTALRAGDDLAVRVLKNGAPLAGFSLAAVREGVTRGAFVKTDSEGRAVFKLNRAGKWLLRGTELRASSRPETEWESDFTTMTFEVH